MNRRTFLWATAAAGGGLLGYGALVEPGRLTFSRHDVRLSRDGPLPGGPTPAQGAPSLRLVQLSDLHLKGVDPLHEELARDVDALAPDLLALTGDTVDAREYLPLAGEFLSLLRTGAPPIGVMGNWEYQGGVSADELGRELRRAGGELLVNRSLALGVRGTELVVTGLDDWLAGAPDVPASLRGVPLAAREAGHHVVLAHCPVQRDEIAGSREAGDPPPWMLAGHTHGGQVGVPGYRFTPRGSGEYVRGWYLGPLPGMYVSRGIGTSVVPVRLGSRPEVAVFDVHLA